MRYVALLMMLSILSCSTTDIMKGAAKMGLGMKDKGISLDTQIGDKEQSGNIGGARGTGNIEVEDDGTVNVETVKNDSNIEEADTVNIHNEPSIFWIIMFLLGWMLPTLPDMMKAAWGGLIKLFKGRTRWRR